jgi:hypothetical protein
MTDKLLDLIGKKYTLCPISAGEFASLKAKGMTFSVSAYTAEGLGHVSVMRAKGFFGLMKMDTLMIVPRKRTCRYIHTTAYSQWETTLLSWSFTTHS